MLPLSLLSCGLLTFVTAVSRPPVVVTAGLFNTITQAGEFSVTQAEHLAAFAMAINEINNKTDGLWDDLLPATRLLFAFAPGIFGRLGPAGVLVKLDASVLAGVVGALPNLEVMTFNEIAQERKLPMVHSIATATELGQGDVYPYMSQTIPIDSYIAKIHQSITCGKKLVIIATTDVVGRRALQELRSGETCDVELLGVVNVESHNFDMTYIVDQVKELGGLWIGLFTPPEFTAAILEQGYELGLFRENMMFFGLSNDFIQHFSPSTDVAAVMTGYFGAEYFPKYSFGRDPDAIAFASRWSKQPSTAGKMVGGSRVCSDLKDNAHYAYMYRSPTNISMCTGLDFSTYPEDGSTIADNTILTYDATILLAKAIHLAIEGGLNPNNGDVIADLILNNVSFKGISGKVEMYPGLPKFDYYARGNRVVGMMFKIVNFHADAYRAGLNPFVPVIGYSSDTNAFAPCPAGRECSYPIFKTNEADKTVPPPDMHPDIIISASLAIKAILFVCSVISFITVAVFTVFTMRNEKAKVVKAAQPAMLYTALLGGMLASARVLVAALHESDLTCQLQNWFGHMAFGVIFGSLFVKSYRVHKLVNCESLKRVKFTSNKALCLVVAIALVFCVMVAVLHAIGHPYLGYIVTLKSNQYTKEEICKLENSDVQTFILVVEFIMIIGGLRLCYLIRNVYDSVNESNLIAAALVIILLVAVIVLFIRMTPQLHSLIASIVFAVGNMVVMSVLFVPKITAVREEQRVKDQPSKKAAAGLHLHLPHEKGNVGLSKPEEGTAGPARSNIDQEGDIDEAIVVSKQALKGMKLQDKLQFCNQQISKWHQLQTDIMTRADDTSNNSKSSVSESQVIGSSNTMTVMQTPNDKMETFSDKFSSALKFVSGKISSKKVYVQNGDIVLDNSNMRSNVSLAIDSFVPSAPAEPKGVKSAWTV